MVRTLTAVFFVFISILSPAPAQANVDMTSWEQWFLYELNRARWNPGQYAQQAGVSLPSQLGALPPLAPNQQLGSAAKAKATEMANHGYFNHRSAVTGMWPNQLVRNHGFALPSGSPNAANNVESLWGGSGARWPTPATFLASHEHRQVLFGSVPNWWFESVNEVGVGRASSGNTRRVVVNVARTDPARLYVTGVAYRDANGNGRMDHGEGLSGVQVTVGNTTVRTNAGGGYAVPVSRGNYTVSASGGGLSGTSSAVVRVGAYNVGVDFISGRSAAEVRAFEMCAGRRPTIMGTAGDDLLRGTPGNDIIHGLDGNDVIRGFGGDDILCGGRGADRIYGGPGNDRLYGGPGRDRLQGGQGNDFLQGGKGRDSLFGGPGINRLNGGMGNDRCVGGSVYISCERP